MEEDPGGFPQSLSVILCSDNYSGVDIGTAMDDGALQAEYTLTKISRLSVKITKEEKWEEIL